jgi:uncharacterized membrane protein YjdF
MTKRKLTFIFIILILLLIFLAIYSGIEFQKITTETMEWQSAKFKITDKTKIFGIGILLSILGYIILRKKISKTHRTQE